MKWTDREEENEKGWTRKVTQKKQIWTQWIIIIQNQFKSKGKIGKEGSRRIEEEDLRRRLGLFPSAKDLIYKFQQVALKPYHSFTFLPSHLHAES